MGSGISPRPSGSESRQRVALFLEEARRLLELHGGTGAPGKSGKKAEAGHSQAPGADRTDVARRLVEANIFYVVQMAGEFRSRKVPFEELLAEGVLGLVEAARRFDPDRDVKFLSYATWWIRKRMLEYINRESSAVRLTRHAREKRRVLLDLEESLRRDLGRDPTLEEVAREAGLDPDVVRRQKDLSPTVFSLDNLERPDAYETLRLAADPRDHPSPEEIVAERLACRRLRRELARLPRRERTILEHRFGMNGREPMTFSSLGRLLGMSRERVRQIEKEALARLRRRLALPERRRRARSTPVVPCSPSPTRKPSAAPSSSWD